MRATFSKLAVYRFIQEQMTRAMRHDYLRALIRMEIGFFDDPKNSAGGLTTTLAKQTQVVANICGLSAGQALESLCAMLIGIGLALFACWRVALAMLGAVPFVGVAMSIVVKMMLTDEGTGGGGAYERIGAIASEAVVNIRTVRACRAEPGRGPRERNVQRPGPRTRDPPRSWSMSRSRVTDCVCRSAVSSPGSYLFAPHRWLRRAGSRLGYRPSRSISLSESSPKRFGIKAAFAACWLAASALPAAQLLAPPPWAATRARAFPKEAVRIFSACARRAGRGCTHSMAAQLILLCHRLASSHEASA